MLALLMSIYGIVLGQHDNVGVLLTIEVIESAITTSCYAHNYVMYVILLYGFGLWLMDFDPAQPMPNRRHETGSSSCRVSRSSNVCIAYPSP